jgi:AraC-like DNA-binding protein
MDALKHILHVVRIQPEVFKRQKLHLGSTSDFSASICSGFHLVEQGHCWYSDGVQEQPLDLDTGDLLVVSNTRHYQLTTDPRVTVDEEVTVVSGVFQAEQNIVYPLFSLLPTLIHIRNQAGQPIYWLTTALRGIASEAAGERPGYEAVISRLMDILFIMVMRSWIDRQQPGEGGWLGALYDPQIGKVLNAIHTQPEYDWSVERLAQIANLSRSMFMERFGVLVGEPPMKYITRWRIQLAMTWLSDDPGLTVEQVAYRVGYVSPFAFSRAFKRLTGSSPTAYRHLSGERNSDLSSILISGDEKM